MLSKSKFQRRCASTRRRSFSDCPHGSFSVGLSVFVYLCLNSKIGKETAGWFCILAAAPVAVAGFFHFNGMTLEQFLWAVIKSQILCAKPRRFVSENFYYVCLGRKERDNFD